MSTDREQQVNSLQLTGISETMIDEKDVLIGRGGRTNLHPGNVSYYRLLDARRVEYMFLETPREKTEYVMNFVQQQRKDGVRFLEKDAKDPRKWNDVGDTKMRKKTIQNLREHQPKLKKQLAALTEHQRKKLKMGHQMDTSALPTVSEQSSSQQMRQMPPNKHQHEFGYEQLMRQQQFWQMQALMPQQQQTHEMVSDGSMTMQQHAISNREDDRVDPLPFNEISDSEYNSVPRPTDQNDSIPGQQTGFPETIEEPFPEQKQPSSRMQATAPPNQLTVEEGAQHIFGSAGNDANFEFEAISLPGERSAKTASEDADTTTNISWSLCQTRSAGASCRSSMASSMATWDAFDSIANDDPSLWSISYAQLVAIHEDAKMFYGDTFVKSTMRDICRDIIEPICQKHGKSYALHKNPAGLRVEAFVTHCWDEPFGDFVESIHKVFQTSVKKPNLWICAFALIQGVSDDFMQEQMGIDGQFGVEASPFVLALRTAKKFVVVRNSVTDLYSRIWCVCELIYARKFGLVPDNTFVTGPDDFSDSHTSCMEAQATDNDDKARILKVLLVDHDYKEIDAFVNQFRAQNSPK